MSVSTEIAVYVSEKYIDTFLNSLNEGGREILSQMDQDEYDDVLKEKNMGYWRLNCSSEDSDVLASCLEKLPQDAYLMLECAASGFEGEPEKFGAMVVPDATFEYDYGYETDDDIEPVEFENKGSKLPLDSIAYVLTEDGASAFESAITKKLKKELSKYTSVDITNDDGEVLRICFNVPVSKDSLSEKLKKVFETKIESSDYFLFIFHQKEFIENWVSGDYYPGEMATYSQGELSLDDVPFEFDVRQTCS